MPCLTPLDRQAGNFSTTLSRTLHGQHRTPRFGVFCQVALAECTTRSLSLHQAKMCGAPQGEIYRSLTNPKLKRLAQRARCTGSSAWASLSGTWLHKDTSCFASGQRLSYQLATKSYPSNAGALSSALALSAHRASRGSSACAQRSRAPPAWPNTSFNRTRYGKRRKPGLRHLVHHLSPGLRRSPPRAG